MHASVMQFLRHHLDRSLVDGKLILEIGSRNVNGSPREVVEQLGPEWYVGVDLSEGDGVDYIVDACAQGVFLDTSYGIVICTEMLEHALDWRQAVYNMKRALRPGGTLICTTRSPGFQRHDPPDYWRFTVDDFRRIFSDMRIVVLCHDSQVPGVMLRAEKLEGDETYLGNIEVAVAPND